MAEVLLFHHALGLTDGVRRFADALRNAGHVVHLPDLFEGRTFDTIEAGVAHAETVGFEEVVARGERAAHALPQALVYAGFSLGVLPAQRLAQTRPGAMGALLLHSCVSPEDLGAPWPAGVRAQVHAMADDPIFRDEGDLEAARALEAAGRAELFLYPGADHLFADDTLPSYDPASTALLLERVLVFLSRA